MKPLDYGKTWYYLDVEPAKSESSDEDSDNGDNVIEGSKSGGDSEEESEGSDGGGSDY